MTLEARHQNEADPGTDCLSSLWIHGRFLRLNAIISGSLVTLQKKCLVMDIVGPRRVKTNLATTWPHKHSAHSAVAKRVRG